jgi:hypothetical protein
VKNNSLVKITNRLAALENLYDDVEINTTWEAMRENIISVKEDLDYYELKKDKPWFDKRVFRTITLKKSQTAKVIGYKPNKLR